MRIRSGVMAHRLAAALSWMLVLASIVFWGQRMWQPTSQQRDGHSAPSLTAVQPEVDLGPLLGSPARPEASLAAPPELASRFRLLGVMAPRPPVNASQRPVGVALIAIDGKPPRPYRVGARLDSERVLLSVAQRSATIGLSTGTPQFVLELPAGASLPTAASARETNERLPTINLPPVTSATNFDPLAPEMQRPEPGESTGVRNDEGAASSQPSTPNQQR